MIMACHLIPYNSPRGMLPLQTSWVLFLLEAVKHSKQYKLCEKLHIVWLSRADRTSLGHETAMAKMKRKQLTSKIKGSKFPFALKDIPKESTHQTRRKQVFVKYKVPQFMRTLGS